MYEESNMTLGPFYERSTILSVKAILLIILRRDLSTVSAKTQFAVM